MKFIVTRPALDSTAISEALHSRGHQVILAPLIEIKPRHRVEVPLQPYQGVCFTSANAARHVPSGVSRQISAFTMGAQSAYAASVAGFMHIEAKGGNVEGLAAHVIKCLKPNNGPLLYISGNETSGDLAGVLHSAGFAVTKLVTYDALPLPLKLSAMEIASCGGVLLYSKRSAKLWFENLQRLEIFPRLSHICLSKQIMEVLPDKWRRRAAVEPTETALLELIDLMAK